MNFQQRSYVNSKCWIAPLRIAFCAMASTDCMNASSSHLRSTSPSAITAMRRLSSSSGIHALCDSADELPVSFLEPAAHVLEEDEAEGDVLMERRVYVLTQLIRSLEDFALEPERDPVPLLFHSNPIVL